MPTTTKGIRYPQNADAVDVAGDIQNLASDADPLIGTVQALTTKGDLLTRSGSAETRQAAGTNDHLLTADSAEATGLKYAAASGSSGGYEYITKVSPANSTTSTITASSIPQTYTDLRIVIQLGLWTSNNYSAYIRFNGRTASTYMSVTSEVQASNTRPSTFTFSGNTGTETECNIRVARGSNGRDSVSVIDWMNYSDTFGAGNPPVVGFLFQSGSFYQTYAGMNVGVGMSTVVEAVSSISLWTGSLSNYFGTDTTMTIYGIKRFGI